MSKDMTLTQKNEIFYKNNNPLLFAVTNNIIYHIIKLSVGVRGSLLGCDRPSEITAHDKSK